MKQYRLKVTVAGQQFGLAWAESPVALEWRSSYIGEGLKQMRMKLAEHLEERDLPVDAAWLNPITVEEV